ncbi:MAG: DNA-binding response regulator [Bacteroidetes bacterium]|nr:MAG: DNA-binding response regulator [Bacteroidota bacterium]
MRKISTLIVDDEPLALELLERYVTQTPFLELTARCSHAFDALEQIHSQQPELIFLDIQMPELNGIELSRSLKNGPKVIFTTAFAQYALDGFRVEALDYLLKPISYEEFLTSANKALRWFEMQDAAEKQLDTSEYIFVKSEYRLLRVDLRDILYIEGLKDYLKIYLSTSPKPVMTLMSLKMMDEKLPSGRFMRVHRSFIVNLDQVQTIERSQIVFGNVRIPVADNYKESFNRFVSSRFLE